MKRPLIITGIAVAILASTFLIITATSQPSTPQASAETTTPSTPKISGTTLQSLIASSTPHTILDVRTAEEYTTGHIKGAILLPSDQLAALATTTLPDKTAKIIVYCQSGVRSSRAATELLELGYTDVSDLGSINAWPDAITTGDTP